MVLHIIRVDILRVVSNEQNATQLAKYPHVLYVKPLIKIYIYILHTSLTCYMKMSLSKTLL